MKKQFLGIVAIIGGLLVTGATFAQGLEYTDCTRDTNGIFLCQEYQSCNNPGGSCVCSKNSLFIPHNTTCLASNTLIKSRVVSSFAVSGSIVTFKFTIKNNLIPKYFELRLPPAYKNPRIKILKLTSDGLSNGGLIALQNGLINPKYFIDIGEKKDIVVTGEIISSSFAFGQIETSACLRNFGSSVCIDEPVTYILPTANYSITQNLLDPKPIFSGQQALYEIAITNNGSKASTDNVSFTTVLGNFLGIPSLALSSQLTDILAPQTSNIWNLGLFSPGETRIYTMKAPLSSTPAAGSLITTTGSISAGSELFVSDNVAVTSYTVPTVIDISLDALQKISPEPEANGEEIGYSVRYSNKGNARAENISLTAIISGTNQTSTIFSLPDLDPETTNTVVITGFVNQNYPVGTRFCFSGIINALNETESGNNNTLSDMCYTFVKSADIAITAKLTNDVVSINKGSTVTYTITLSNKGEKIANNVVVNLYPSANQTSQTPIVLSGITLAGGEEKTISYTSLLNDYPMQGTTISLSGSISFTGIDLDLSNNTFSLSDNLPGLADIYISHRMLPFSGFKLGDTVTYIITYGNSGFAAAWNPMINLTLPASITASQNEWNLGKSIAAGATGSIVVTGTLNQFLTAGTEFSSQARITTPSAQITTGNDISLITGTVATYNTLIFGLSGQNDSRSIGNVSPQLIRAASGHIISFTITYANNGNVPAENATIRIDGLQGVLALDPFTSNIGTIGINQQNKITITGRIVSRGFTPISPTVTIAYTNGTGVSRTFTIEEPYQCGDGLLTRDEVCEPGLTPTNPDQTCENQQGVCRLVTQRITNRACVEVNGVLGECSDAVINLSGASCNSLQLERIDDTIVNARCFATYPNTRTPFSISCGNGQTISGFSVGTSPFFEGRCSYASETEADNARISCNVGSANNAACTASVLSCDLDLESQVVILDTDEEEGTVEVECSTRNGKPASLQIDCGNGTSEIERDDHIRHTCTYKEKYFSSNRDRTMNIQCLVNGAPACEDEVILDEGIIGICGDGVRQGYEQCDLGGDQTINRFLDNDGERADEEDEGMFCNNCSIEDKAPAQCLSVHNGNISIEKGEFLPFWWKVNEKSFATKADCSDIKDKGKIIKSSMECEFELQKPGKAGNADTKEILTRPCVSTPDENTYPLFSYFNKYMTANTWRYAVDPNAFNNRIDDDFGEYKLRLKNIEYKYCADEDDIKKSSTDNVCETNFTITKPYLVQKSAFGLIPKATDIDLSDFYDINKNSIISRTDLEDIMILDANDYEGEGVIKPMITSFVAAAERLAVKTTSPLKDATAKKVPNKDIYILYGKNGNDLKVINGANIKKPFTLIVKDANLVIDGNIDVNGMFIVQNGTIKFTDTSCNGQQVVKGIFVANTFSAVKNLNDSLKKTWCNAGGLHVKGVLIGGNIQTLVENKRSNLSTWFKVSGTTTTQKTQRRNMIFNGASVLIEYSPELWQQLPPGADEFTKALDVYKK